MLHMKGHLRFHFKKHEKLEKHANKKMRLTLLSMVHLMMQSGVFLSISNLALYGSFISYTVHDKQNC